MKKRKIYFAIYEAVPEKKDRFLLKRRTVRDIAKVLKVLEETNEQQEVYYTKRLIVK